ncbi:MAG: hypothetical protein JJT89_00155 [Nitriliruptoraceae bacterium]|nr:hypothetical protein [Nitriliruptoraceae bacterium]
MSAESTAADRDTPRGPLAGAPDERRLATGALTILAVLAVPVGAVAYLAVGWDGVVSAMFGLGLVAILFGASAALTAWVAARNPHDAGIGVMVAGVLVRLPLYVVALSLLTRVSFVHGRSLAAATAVAVTVTLAYELRLLARMPRLFHVDAAAATPTAVATDARSEPL